MHPLHRAPRDRHCCPTRAGPVPFLKIAPQASARCPCLQCGGSHAVSQPHTLSKSAILHRFPNFYTLRVEIFRMFLYVDVYIWPLWTMKSFMKIGPPVFFSQKFGRQTDGRTDRRGNFIYYIDSGCDDVRPVLAQEQCVSSSLHQWRVEAAASDNVDLDEWTSLRSMFSNHNNNHNNYVHSTFVYLTKPRPHQQQCPSNIRLCCHKRQLVSWSLTSSPFSANMAISETKGQGWRAIPTQWRKARHKMQQCNDYLLVY